MELEIILDLMKQNNNNIKKFLSTITKENHILKENAEDGKNIHIHKLTKLLQRSIIQEVMGEFGKEDIYTLIDLEEWSSENPETQETKKWENIKFEYKIDKRIIRRIRHYVKGNSKTIQISEIDFHKARHAVEYYPPSHRNGLLELIDITEKYIKAIGISNCNSNF